LRLIPYSVKTFITISSNIASAAYIPENKALCVHLILETLRKSAASPTISPPGKLRVV
jgi:hypothetical protein